MPRISEEELISYLLRLIDVGQDCPLLSRNAHGSLHLNENFTLFDGRSERPVATHVRPFIRCYQQVNELSDLIKSTGTVSVLSQVMHEYLIRYLSEHCTDVASLYGRKDLSLYTLPSSTRNFRIVISVLHNLSLPLLRKHQSEFEKIDDFLENFLNFALIMETKSKLEAYTIGRVQEVFIPTMLQYFDHIFQYGTVEHIFNEEFKFYTDEKNRSTLQVRQVRCRLWSESLIRYILSGARSAWRIRLAAGDSIELKKFSLWFEEAVGPNYFQRIHFMRENVLLWSLEIAAEKCAKESASLLFKMVTNDSSLKEILEECQKIYSGCAVREFMTELFQLKSSMCMNDIVQSFYNTLKLWGFSSSSCQRWTLTCDEDSVNIRPKIPLPITYIIDEEVITAMMDCLHFSLKLDHAADILANIIIQRKLPAKLFAKRRKFCYLVDYLAQPISMLSELLHTHLNALFARKIPLVLSSRSVEEAHGVMLSLKMHLSNLVSRKSGRLLIHSAIDKLCSIAEELSNRFLEGFGDDFSLDDLIVIVKKERKLLLGMSRSMEGTVFSCINVLLS
ncbi:hypothetical protein AB6A40_002580 [Gnathostoma spinigerum]|uniref:Spindle pole body component n=1 Tax=Gnathostoma spinigerum TaxID=75299 RepID=A0ABD6E9J6_9BILA